MNQQKPPSSAHLDAPVTPLSPPAQQIAALHEALGALPELRAPEGIWQAVRQRVDRGAHRRRWSVRRKTRMALAASVLLAASVGLALALRFPVRASAGDVLPTLLERSQLAEEMRRHAMALPVSSDTERILRARIGGIDASLNQLLRQESQGTASRDRLLRERVDLMESLVYIERNRREALVRQVLF